MGLSDIFRRSTASVSQAARAMAVDGGVSINTPAELEAALRGSVTGSGAMVNSGTAMQVGAVFACVRIISGAVTNVPLHIKRRLENDVREDAPDTALRRLLRYRPNLHQTARQFRRVMQVDVLSEHGNAYAHITWGVKGEPIQLIRLDPARTVVKQKADLTKEFEFTGENGRKVVYGQKDILHLFGLTLDGIRGVGPIRYARETIGDSLTLARHGSTMFKNGARVSGVLETEKTLGLDGIENLKASLDTFRAGAENEGKDMILEDGLSYKTMALTSQDAQWMEARAFSRADIAMFYGVPPHMIGVTEKTTSWGSGIRGFKDFKGFVKSVLGSFKNMIAEMIAYALKNKILISLGLGGASIGGAGGSAGGLLGGMFGNLLGSFGAAGGAAASGLLGGLGSTLGIGAAAGANTGLLGIGAGAAAAGGGLMATIGAALPVIGIGLALFSLFKKKPIIKKEDFAAIQRGLELTGKSLLSTGKMGKKAAAQLMKAAGGIEAFGKQTQFYFDNFFTDAEKREKALESLNNVFGNLGMALPQSAAEFRSIVEGLDLTTAAGRKAYSEMLKVAPVFTSVFGSIANAGKQLSGIFGDDVFSTKEQMMRAISAVNRGGEINILPSGSGVVNLGELLSVTEKAERLQAETALSGVATAGSMSQLYKLMRKWDMDGMPPEQTA